MTTNKEKKSRMLYAGAGIPLGAGVGATVGQLLYGDLAIGAGIGAAVGLLLGAMIDLLKNRAGESA